MSRLVNGEEVGPRYQEICVDSWFSTGCSVNSVNPYEEIRTLRPRFPRVHFLPVPRRQSGPAQKRLPRIAEILDFMHRRHSGTSLFVNADILLNSAIAVRKSLEAHATDGLLIASRVNIPTIDASEGRLFQFGFDFFAMPSRLASKIEDGGFEVGRPIWDLWLPTVALMLNIPVRRFGLPAALHLEHPQNWDSESMILGVRKYVASFRRFAGSTRPEGRSAGAAALVEHMTKVIDDSLKLKSEIEQVIPIAQQAAFFFGQHPSIPVVG